MGEADTPRVSSTVDYPTQGGAVAPPTTHAAPQPYTAPAFGSMDPLSLPYTLPSTGLYYGVGKCPDGRVIISPTRGAQEEILAGAQGNPGTALPALRHVAAQCINTQGLPFNELLLFDFTAVLFNFLALSNGTDELTLSPTHDGCGKSFQQTIPLTRLRSTRLRRADPDEEAAWPPLTHSEDDAMAVLREMEEADVADGGTTDLVLPPGAVDEPFQSEPLPHTSEIIGWRYHRVHDLVRAEEFIARSKGQASGKLHSFLMAAQLVSINGRPLTGMLEAMTWVNRQPTPILNALRDEVSLRDFGYDVNPRFRCPHCGGSFRRRLPIDGSLFRRSRRS